MCLCGCEDIGTSTEERILPFLWMDINDVGVSVDAGRQVPL